MELHRAEPRGGGSEIPGNIGAPGSAGLALQQSVHEKKEKGGPHGMSPLNVTCVSADSNCTVNSLWLPGIWGRRDIYCQTFHEVLNFGGGFN